MTVGGIVSEAKKVRTRSGAYVMFATLDDLEGRVELFVRDAAGEAAEQIELDRVILVRGRVDHKGRGEIEPRGRRGRGVRARRGRGRRGTGEGRERATRSGSCCRSTPPSSAHG